MSRKRSGTHRPFVRFVSKYMLELPKKEEMQAYIEQRILAENHEMKEKK